MNIKDFLDLPEDQREYIIEIHNKQKEIRKTRQDIEFMRNKLNTREFNNQLECTHPDVQKTYKAHENEFGNFTGGGEYECFCEDCGKIWREYK